MLEEDVKIDKNPEKYVYKKPKPKSEPWAHVNEKTAY